MKLLLHICCANCLIYPLQRFKQEGIEVTGYFYNPNIHPLAEYKKRRQTLTEYSKQCGLDVEYVKGYDLESFFQNIAGCEAEPARCRRCYQMRLQKTAEFARDNGFDAFSTTLLVSPYQQHEILQQTGQEIAEAAGIEFFYQDFRSGWNQALEESKNLRLYRQKYCGCLYSERDRYRYARN